LLLGFYRMLVVPVRHREYAALLYYMASHYSKLLMLTTDRASFLGNPKLCMATHTTAAPATRVPSETHRKYQACQGVHMASASRM